MAETERVIFFPLPVSRYRSLVRTALLQKESQKLDFKGGNEFNHLVCSRGRGFGPIEGEKI